MNVFTDIAIKNNPDPDKYPGRAGHLTNVPAGPDGRGRSGSRVSGRCFHPGLRVVGRGLATPRDPAKPNSGIIRRPCPPGHKS